jgi:histidine ammonia-lyase
VYAAVRRHVSFLEHDRQNSPETNRLTDLILGGELIAEVSGLVALD